VQSELRIHGVSGTPNDVVVGGPVTVDDRFTADPSTVYRPANGDGRLLAYRWASRTSGTAASAMWLLLVPYMLVNLAGWALPPATDRRHRLSVAAVRIAGLALTLVFALLTATGVIGVGAFQVLRELTSWSLALTLGVATAAAVMAILWFSTTRADSARNDRPYLRAPHIAVALWGVWATAVTAAAEASGSANPIGSMWALPVAMAVLTAAASLWHGLEDVTRLFGRVAVGATLLLLVSVVIRPLDTVPDLPAVLGTLGGPIRGAVLAYVTSAVAVTALAWSKSHRDAGPVVGSFLALAGATGAAVGAGAVVVSGWIFDVAPSDSLGVLAEAFLAGLLCMTAFLAFHMWTHLEPATDPRERLFRTLVSVRDDLRPLLMALPIVTLAVGAVGLGGFGDALPWLAAGVGPLAVAAAAGVGFRLGFRVIPVAMLIVGASIIGVIATGIVSFRTAAVATTLILPVLAVGVRIAGAWGDADRRRILAIPWDIGSFFSRRFHPFAPPTYRDVVERDLRTVLLQLRSNGPVIVSAHSQGSIVAAAALDSLPGTDLRLLTHGSPLASLYMRYFPISFPAETPERIAVRPWINLWRPTDPIGGAVRGSDDRRIDDIHLRVHGGYWMDDEPEYRRAVENLRAVESSP
jgi:hypothetical protein